MNVLFRFILFSHLIILSAYAQGNDSRDQDFSKRNGKLFFNSKSKIFTETIAPYFFKTCLRQLTKKEIDQPQCNNPPDAKHPFCSTCEKLNLLNEIDLSYPRHVIELIGWFKKWEKFNALDIVALDCGHNICESCLQQTMIIDQQYDKCLVQDCRYPFIKNHDKKVQLPILNFVLDFENTTLINLNMKNQNLEDLNISYKNLMVMNLEKTKISDNLYESYLRQSILDSADTTRPINIIQEIEKRVVSANDDEIKAQIILELMQSPLMEIDLLHEEIEIRDNSFEELSPYFLNKNISIEKLQFFMESMDSSKISLDLQGKFQAQLLKLHEINSTQNTEIKKMLSQNFKKNFSHMPISEIWSFIEAIGFENLKLIQNE